MSAPTALTIYGGALFIGKTVAAFVCGLDCGNYTVASDGSITVPYGSDPGGLFTQSYLISQSAEVTGANYGALGCGVDLDVNGTLTRATIPVAVGFTYTSQGQRVRAQVQMEDRTQEGPGFGDTRRMHQFAVQFAVAVTGTVSFGSDFAGTLTAANFSTAFEGPVAEPTNVVYSGMFWNVLNHGYDMDGMLTWQVTRPVPCTISAVGDFAGMEEH